MKALLAFIIMAVVILTLIEINERRKAKRPKDDCPQEKGKTTSCEGCSLQEACTADKKSTAEP